MMIDRVRQSGVVAVCLAAAAACSASSETPSRRVGGGASAKEPTPGQPTAQNPVPAVEPEAATDIVPCTGDTTDVLTAPRINGILTGDSPTQHGWFVNHVNPPNTPLDQAYSPPSCDKPSAVSPVTDESSEIHYDAYTFRNAANDAACISVEVITTPFPLGGNGSVLRTAAYLGSYDPNDITRNYIADTNFGEVAGYSFHVPALSDFVVVVSGTPGQPGTQYFGYPGKPALYRPYALFVVGCGKPVSGSSGSASGPTPGKAW